MNNAQRAKNDEFYTQYYDIEREVNAYLEYNPDVFRGKTILLPCDDPEWSNFTKYFAQNFTRFGLKKLISTSYAPESKKYKIGYQPTLFETESPIFDADKTLVNGKIFTLTEDSNGDGKVDVNDLKYEYLEGDGDFRSDEIKKLRDAADIIITNPPFSLFREFLAWIIEADKQFLIIGNMNAITYKEVFPLIRDNKMWLGATGNGTDMVFGVPEGASVKEEDRKKAERLGYKGNYTRLGNSCWFSSIEHGKRHRPLPLMTMADNVKYSKHKDVRGIGYLHYDNYDAIEVPHTDAIPSDYSECLGVPVSFIDKYCPEQFKIIGATESEGRGFSGGLWNEESGIPQATINGNKVYKRLFIKALTPPLNQISINELRDYVINMYGFSSSDVVIVSGVMGVPISFVDKYCPEQFVIIGLSQFGCHPGLPDTRKYNDYQEILRATDTPTGSFGGKTNENAVLKGKGDKKTYYLGPNGEMVYSEYKRIFIRKIQNT